MTLGIPADPYTATLSGFSSELAIVQEMNEKDDLLKSWASLVRAVGTGWKT